MKFFPRARWVALTSIVATSFLSGAWLTRAKPSAEGNVYQQARLFENVVGAVHRHYIDSMGEGDLYQRAASALVTSLNDPYAELLVRENYREYKRQMSGNKVELGVQDEPTESGAGLGESSGIEAGDEIVSIDGRSTVGWSSSKMEDALRGGATRTLTVVVRPVGSDRTVVRKITRTSVHIPAASSGVLLDGGVGYVVLHRMSEHAADELRAGRRPAEAGRHEGPGARSPIQSGRVDPRGREGGRAVPPAGRYRGDEPGALRQDAAGLSGRRVRPTGMTSGWCFW